MVISLIGGVYVRYDYLLSFEIIYRWCTMNNLLEKRYLSLLDVAVVFFLHFTVVILLADCIRFKKNFVSIGVAGRSYGCIMSWDA